MVRDRAMEISTYVCMYILVFFVVGKFRWNILLPTQLYFLNRDKTEQKPLSNTKTIVNPFSVFLSIQNENRISFSKRWKQPSFNHNEIIQKMFYNDFRFVMNNSITQRQLVDTRYTVYADQTLSICTYNLLARVNVFFSKTRVKSSD